MKTIVLLFIALLSVNLWAAPLQYTLGPETVLFSGGSGDATHTAFPHATTDGQGNLWLVYRKAETHAGGIGVLWLAKYRLADMKLLSNGEIYKSATMDSRDPTITFKDGILYLSFFQYNYTFNMVRQFVLLVNASTITPMGPEKMLQNAGIFNHSSSTPLIWLQDHWVLPVYYVNNFYSKATDVGYFSFDKMLTNPSAALTTIGKGSSANSFFLEPSIAIDGDHWVSLFRTSPIADGPGGVAIMMLSESKDGGKSWTYPRGTPFMGHHPRMMKDEQGRMWAGFRDLSEYDETNYKAKITLWQLNANQDGNFPSTDKQITIFSTNIVDQNNWDCGYPSWIQMDAKTFRAVYYYDVQGKYYIATRLVNLN